MKQRRKGKLLNRRSKTRQRQIRKIRMAMRTMMIISKMKKNKKLSTLFSMRIKKSRKLTKNKPKMLLRIF